MCKLGPVSRAYHEAHRLCMISGYWLNGDPHDLRDPCDLHDRGHGDDGGGAEGSWVGSSAVS